MLHVPVPDRIQVDVIAMSEVVLLVGDSVLPITRLPHPAASLAAALRLLHDVPIGDILLTTVEGRTLRLRRVARPNAEQADLLAALKITLPERLCADREVTDSNNFRLPTERTPPKM